MLSPALIDSVANTTIHRDRDELDRAIVTLLSQFLDAPVATLYRLEMDAGNHYLRRGVTAVHGLEVDGSSQQLHSSERLALNGVPAWHKCVTERKAVPYSSVAGACRTAFPIASERGVVGILELETRSRLSSRDSNLVGGILRIVKNHLALLDYSESDTLTGLLNRKTFETRFCKLRTTSGALNKEEPSWLGVVDIDKFKSINDTYGHLFGDEVLLLVAGLLKQGAVLRQASRQEQRAELRNAGRGRPAQSGLRLSGHRIVLRSPRRTRSACTGHTGRSWRGFNLSRSGSAGRA
jgi:hypothetical protein